MSHVVLLILVFRSVWGSVHFNQPLNAWNVSSVTDMSTVSKCFVDGLVVFVLCCWLCLAVCVCVSHVVLLILVFRSVLRSVPVQPAAGRMGRGFSVMDMSQSKQMFC